MSLRTASTPIVAAWRLCVRRGALLSWLLIGFVAPVLAADSNKVVRYAFEIAETGFDPAQVSDYYSSEILEAIIDPMLTYDYLARPVKLIPNTLEAMPDVNDNGATYTFRLKKGIHFTPDGAFKGVKRELTAADYAYSIRRFYDPKLRSPYLFFFEGKIIGADEVMASAKATGKYDYDTSIAGLEVIDRYTLRIRLKEPDYNFLYVLAFNLTGAVAREVVEAYGDDIISHPVGTGPFVLKEWRHSSRIVLEANPEYRDEVFNATPEDTPEDRAIVQALQGRKLPIIGRVEIYVVEEQQPRWLAFLNGEHDYLYPMPEEFINLAAPGGKVAPNLAKRGIRAQTAPEIDLVFTFYNMEDPVIGGYTAEKVALRRALNLAYNRNEELFIRWKGQAVMAQSPIPPGAAGYDGDFRSAASQYDPARAKALLDMYGYVDRDGDGWREAPDGQPLELEVASPPDSQYRPLDEIWKKSADAIGIRVRFKKERWPDLLKQGKLGKLQVGNFLSWHADYPDGDNFLQLLYGPNSGQSNDSYFKLPEFDRLYAQARRLPDSPDRNSLYREMNRLIIAYAPWNIRLHRLRTTMVQPWLKGQKAHPILHQGWKYLDVDVDAQRAARP